MSDAIERIENIERISRQMEELSALMRPLAQHLLPLGKQKDLDGEPRQGRSITLKASDWPKQWRNGVDRCVGFDIVWEAPFPAGC